MQPIVTLTSDFGLLDWYVAAMKAFIWKACPDARLLDITHNIEPQNIPQACVCLERAINLGLGAIHLSVVDPGVGSPRKLLIARWGAETVICPDNGLISWAWNSLGPAQSLEELTWRPAHASPTFHGRDILAPAAGMLAAGHPLQSAPLANPILLNLAPARSLQEARIIYFDHFGNAITNLPAHLLKDHLIILGPHNLGKVRQTYSQAPSLQSLALINSSGLLEIAIRDGSARQMLSLSIDQRVRME